VLSLRFTILKIETGSLATRERERGRDNKIGKREGGGGFAFSMQIRALR